MRRRLARRCSGRLGRSAVLSIALLLLAGCSSSHNHAATASTPPTDVTSVKAAYMAQVHATVLVTNAGYALYLFLPDRQKAVNCGQLCLKSWPLVYEPSHGQVQAGPGVQANLLASVAGPTGKPVVTYNRWPLYTYTDDDQPGFATGQGVDLDGGYWYLVQPDGSPLVPSGLPSSASSAPSS